mgnify:FL=1
MTRTMIPAAAGLAAALAAPVAGAQGIDPSQLVQGTLRPGWQAEDGTQIAALDLTLTPGWKTYWRAPGEAGIPPTFDWTGSTNLDTVRLRWPTPSVFYTSGMRSIGYHDGLLLPIEVVPVDPAQPVRLQLRVDMGICLDICVPASVAMAGELAGPGAPEPGIAAALADQPMDPSAAGLTRIGCAAEAIADGWRLTATLDMPPLGPDETVAVEVDQPDVWVSEAEAVRDGATLTAVADVVPIDLEGFTLDRAALRVTVIGDGTAMEAAGCPAP